MSKEPIALLRGKEFHKLIQKEWEEEAEGDITRERHIIKKNGRKGRVDIFVNDDDPKSPIAIVEIKATNWDKILEKNINRNIRRQIKQIWDYIESQILDGKFTENGEHKDVCPGIIFPHMPKDKTLKQKIENDFEEYGITAVWHDEEIKKNNS